MNIAHLENAARQSGHLPADVPFLDLDLVIDRQGESHVFVGGRADKREDVAARHLYARGLSLTAAAPRLGTGRSQTLGKKRYFKPLSFNVEATAETVNGNLQSSDTLQNVGTRIQRVVKTYLDHIESASPGQKPRSFLPLAMLQIYTQAQEADEIYLRFDSISLSKSCQHLLRRIRDMCKTEAPAVYPMYLFSKEDELGDFLGAVFARPYDEISKWPKACQMLRDLIAAQGGAEIAKARKRMLLELPSLGVIPDNANI